MNHLISLAARLYNESPLLKGRDIEFKNDFVCLSKDDKISFLAYSFKKYDKGFTQSMILYLPCLWEDFDAREWRQLIRKMFPREIEFEWSSLKINTGWYTDIYLLNGIIGISPFEYIFSEINIGKLEKERFYDVLKYRGEVLFYANERQLIEDVVNFYELDLFNKIVNIKDKLLSEGFYPAIKYEDMVDKITEIIKRKT